MAAADAPLALRTARDLPHSLEAEQAVLGAILIDETAFAQVAALLRPEDFYRLEHQHMYAACQELAGESKTLDPVLVLQRLDAKALLGAAVPRELPLSLARAIGTTANVTDYARTVQDLARLRQMMLTAQRVVERGYEAGTDVKAFVADAARDIDEAAEPWSDAEDDLAAFARPMTIEMLRAARAREKLALADLPGRCGWGEEMDRCAGGGLMPGDVVAIGAAGSGAGKTALFMQIADGLAIRSAELVGSGGRGVVTPILLVSELSAEALMHRTLARCLNVGPSVLAAGRSAERWMPVGDVDDVFRRAEALLAPGGLLDPLPRWQLVMRPHEERHRFLAEVHRRLGMLRDRTSRLYPTREVWPILVVDPIQRWQDPQLSEVEALNILAEDLDTAADREGWIVLATSDTNKLAARGEDESGVGAFRGSMKLQHACDMVLLLDPGEPVTDAGTPREATVTIVKNRGGPPGARVPFAFYAGRGLRFEARTSSPRQQELSRPHRDRDPGPDGDGVPLVKW